MHEAIVSKIMLATDFSASANLAQVYTKYLAMKLKASVVVLNVSEQRSSTARALNEDEIQASLRRLQETIEEHAVPVNIQRSTGMPGDQILSTARELDADLIVIGLQGHTHLPYGLLGATAQTVTSSAPCPVLTVPLTAKEASPCTFTAPAAMTVRRILAPVDFSEPSLDSLECAIHLARALGADLVLLHVLEPVHANWDLPRMQGAEQIRDHWKARLVNLAGVVKTLGLSATYEIRSGYPSDSILACALQQRSELIVMGTHGRRGRGEIPIGSVAEAVLKEAPCPVLTVKHPKFISGRHPSIQAVLSQSTE